MKTNPKAMMSIRMIMLEEDQKTKRNGMKIIQNLLKTRLSTLNAPNLADSIIFVFLNYKENI